MSKTSDVETRLRKIFDKAVDEVMILLDQEEDTSKSSNGSRPRKGIDDVWPPQLLNMMGSKDLEEATKRGGLPYLQILVGGMLPLIYPSPEDNSKAEKKASGGKTLEGVKSHKEDDGADLMPVMDKFEQNEQSEETSDTQDEDEEETEESESDDDEEAQAEKGAEDASSEDEKDELSDTSSGTQNKTVGARAGKSTGVNKSPAMKLNAAGKAPPPTTVEDAEATGTEDEAASMSRPDGKKAGARIPSADNAVPNKTSAAPPSANDKATTVGAKSSKVASAKGKGPSDKMADKRAKVDNVAAKPSQDRTVNEKESAARDKQKKSTLSSKEKDPAEISRQATTQDKERVPTEARAQAKSPGDSAKAVKKSKKVAA